MNKASLLVIVGFVMIGILFVIYSRYQDSELITPNAIEAIIRLSVGFYITILVAFVSIGYGLYLYHKDKINDINNKLGTIIAKTTWNTKSRRIFIVTCITYGIFFSLTSGTLVYQPEVQFSYHYGVDIPSVQISPCCDVVGYRPLILVYLTDNIGLQIIPINLVLQVTVSYLVGLNTALAISAMSLSRKKRGVSSVGAITGLFIACPTCVGSFLSVFVGTASGIALTIAITQLQTIFIGISIPILLVTPFILAKKIQNASCEI